jgi:DNA-binding transcriptional LysR family regulator
MDKPMQLTPDLLRTFVAAARTLNFTHAARSRHLTQSAVSMQICRLEADLGKTLFRRVTRGVELTADGESLLRYARRLLQLHDEALATLTRPEVDGIIRLGAAEDYASQHLPRILRRFGRRYPLVRVDVYCDLSVNLLEMLRRDALDLYLCTSENGEHGGDFLRHEPVVWIAPQDTAVEAQRPLPLAVYHQGCPFRKWAMQSLAEQGIPYRVAYSSPSIAGVLAAVRAGLAVAPVGASIPVAGFRRLPEAVFKGLPAAVISLHQANHPASDAQRCLAQYISEIFRNLPAVPSAPHPVLQTMPAQPL